MTEVTHNGMECTVKVLNLYLEFLTLKILERFLSVNPFKPNGVKWLHFKVFGPYILVL